MRQEMLNKLRALLLPGTSVPGAAARDVSLDAICAPGSPVSSRMHRSRCFC
jgi:hypothetical protein